MSEEFHRQNENAKRRVGEQRDHGLELSGQEAGQQKRFLPDHLSPRKLEEKKRREDAMRFASLAVIMATQEQIDAVMGKLDHLQSRLDEAFAAYEARMDDINLRTIYLDDGRAIYRIEGDGNFRTVDGDIIAARDLPENIPENATSWAEFTAAIAEGQKLGTIQDNVSAWTDEVNNGDMTSERVDEMLDQINELEVKLDNNLEAEPKFDTSLSGSKPAALDPSLRVTPF